MNQNELRIGNYVTDSKTGKVVTVDGIQFTGRIVTHDESYDDWKRGIEPVGIPITPEILEKAGFEKGGFGSTKISIKNNLLIEIDCVQEITVVSNDKGEILIVPYVQPLHLHQLQNLYFALTGEELPVEL